MDCLFNPSWRWNTVGRLRDYAGPVSFRGVDPLIRATDAFLRKRDGLTPRRASARFLTLYPGLAEAIRLHEQGGRQPFVLETRVLARQSVSEIASAMGLSEEVVGTYEALFYDVRERINAKVWIHQQVIGWRGMRPTRYPHRETLIRRIAYFGGPFLTEWMLASEGLPAMAGAPPFTEEQRQWMTRQLTLNMRLEAEPLDDWTLFRLHAMTRGPEASQPVTMEAVLRSQNPHANQDLQCPPASVLGRQRDPGARGPDQSGTRDVMEHLMTG
jgi:hypothetical protein